jgi:2-methylcitrate dehydratase PrpD
MNETAVLADYAARTSYEDIPSAVLQRARHTICDTVGAIIFGYDLPWSQMIADYATTYGAGGRSHILGRGAGCVLPPMAALVNGALSHSFELDGSAKPSCGAHPCATIFPAVLAVAQERGLGGKAALTAFVVATEVLLRIGTATGKSNEHRGFHGPATTGPFAATVGVGKLLDFDATKLTQALGIAGSLSAGLLQFSRAGTGGMVNSLHFGRANESGVVAANLAERGFSGPHDILEGELGFLNVFCDTSDKTKLTAGLSETFMTLNIYMKRYACHGTCQAPLQASEELRNRRPISAEDIEEIEVHGAQEIVARHDIRMPRDATIAQYSVPFAVALSFFADPKNPRAFSQAAVEDARIAALTSRVRLVGDGTDNSRAMIRVRLTNGDVLEERVTTLRATPSAPPSRDEVYEKFSVLTQHHDYGRMKEIFERLQAIESERDLSWLAMT